LFIKANDGQEALDTIAIRRVDLVLTDVMMARGGGFETCRGIKEDERCLHIPVIMITALGSKSARIQTLHGHATTVRIITEGDGRTMPHHFEPQVLKAFMETAPLLEEMYEKLTENSKLMQQNCSCPAVGSQPKELYPVALF
jgi:CheY-like chemotaxis protein